MKMFRWAATALLSLALLGPIAAAPVRNTAPYVPTTSVGFGKVNETFVPVSADDPLPVTIVGEGGGGGSSDAEANPGSDATKAVSVQGVTSGKPVIAGGQYNSSAPTLTNGQTAPLQFTTSGALIISPSGGVIGAVGNVAHDAVDSGAPTKIGGYASTTAPTAVAAGDRVNAWYGLNGQTVIATSGAANADGISAANGIASPDGVVRPLSAAGFVYNGTSWDRARGSTNGLWVQGAAADGATAAGNPVPSAGVDSAGNAQVLRTDTDGVLASPKAGTSNRTVTKTSVSADTSTQICPTATNPVATEIQTSIGGVGLGFSAQSLTAATLGATTTDADLVIPTAYAVYSFPVAPTNAITARATSGFIAVCIQTLRQ